MEFPKIRRPFWEYLQTGRGSILRPLVYGTSHIYPHPTILCLVLSSGGLLKPSSTTQPGPV